MKHTSVRLETPCEFINIEPINPLISKCQIKVCYVGQQPNRNRSIITKEVATQMANSLPGSPIIGYYREEDGDFVQHTKEITIEDGKIKMTSKTRPYGFVDMGAKVWFQKYLDDNEVEREYLVTEGYIWTGQYPEAKRVIDQGNNQSMELSEEFTKGEWTKDIKGNPEFFIINEPIVSALCILGEEWEPCFEGSTITKVEFSLEDEFYTQMNQMIFQLQSLLDKGGKQMTEELKETEVVAEDVEFQKKDDEKEEAVIAEEQKEEVEASEEEDEKKKKGQYSLEDIPEYVELKNEYAALEAQINALKDENANLTNEISALKEFKLDVEKKQKEDMITNEFYMLSDEDKADVVEHINEYSLEEIESKLSVICVRKKVNFNLSDEDEKEENTEPVTYNLEDTSANMVPGWVQAIEAVKNR